MKRIVVIGCPGTGKTNFARKLGKKLFLPVHHLDTYYWKENWEPMPQDEFIGIQRELIKGEKWIIDGNYVKTIKERIAAADTIIFLDISKRIVLWRFLMRLIRTGNITRLDIGGNTKGRVPWKFLTFVLKYPTEKIYQMLEGIEEDKKIIIFHSSKDADSFIEHVL